VTFYSRPVPDYLNLQLSHTYVDPINLDNGAFLKFRPRHIFQGGVEADLQFLHTGLDYRYIKKYDRIDEKFSLLIEDADARVDAHIVDFRVSKKFNLRQMAATLSLVVNNLFQYYYVDLVGSLAPLRQIVLTLDFSL
jgi:outer membrane cobalamin receptor